MLTSAQVDALIDAKYALLGDIIDEISSLISHPKVSYSIDGESWDFNARQSWLGEQQMKEIAALEQLLKLKNIVDPYQYQSKMI